ncbi:MAG: coagulation factor 5/8 type domain-containing protein [bacterium]
MRILRRSVRRDIIGATTAFAVLVGVPQTQRLAAKSSDPDFGPNVTIFDSSTPADTIQAKLDAVFKTQESSQFGDARFALLFKPGTYAVNAKVGFYTQISGLGLSPDDVIINGGVSADARWRKGNATLNFWRIVENMSVNPAGGFVRWAVSQAAPMRRMHIRSDLVLDDGGWSSGGFLADSKVDGQVKSGSQQQWLTRNSELGSWSGANWNMVFVGTQNAPAQSFPAPPHTTVPSTPAVREKPFLYVDASGAWNMFVPALRSNTSGITWSGGKAQGVAHPLSDFVIIKPGSSVATMNEALAHNKNLIITPGIYHVDAPLHVTRANTIVLGLGLATFVADNGSSAIMVDDVDGVIIAGVLIEAGVTNSPILVQVGAPGSSAAHASNPTHLTDVFVRVGGAGVGKATQSVVINSNSVIGDHLWLWRADHGNGVGWTSNTADNGLVVNGNDVTMYGLFVEHYQGHQVRWNGNGGRTYFYQNEMPYDVPEQGEWMNGTTKGFAAYRVSASVTSHEAWGLGSYCFFNKNPSVVADRAFEAPVATNVKFHDMVTVSLGGGKGTIAHVINDSGASATAGAIMQKLVGGPL